MKTLKRITAALIITGLMLSMAGCAAMKGEIPQNYSVFCCDENGDALEGASIQFCDIKNCMLAKSDADGMAAIDKNSGTYTVHALKAPEGYVIETTETVTLSSPSETFTFRFKKED